MKLVIRTALVLSTIATTAIAQVVTPVWVEHLNGEQGVTPANRLPILRKNPTGADANNGSSAKVSFGKLLPYDNTRYLLFVRENGIVEGSATPADAILATNYPDRSLIWINATSGAPMGIAHVFPIQPIAITGQDTQFDTFNEYGLAEDGHLYYGHKNKILRYAKTGADSWSSTPTCCWTAPTVGATDCNGNALDDSISGDGNRSMRWREFRVSGAGSNTVLFCGGGTFRMGGHPQVFRTTDGTNFFPVAILNNRDNGTSKNEYALGGSASRVIRYGRDGSRPNAETVYTGHYPGTGYEGRPNRYQCNPDNPERIITPYSYTPTDSIYVYDRGESATNGLPAFNWEAAGKDGLPQVLTVDGDQYYDGNWSVAMDAHASLDYVVSYSCPSWNNVYGQISGTNYQKPGWIGVHRLDGTIALNSAWKLPCVEGEINTSSWGYCGDVTVYPDTNAPANLDKASFVWNGGNFGFGLFTVQNVAAAISVPPPASITLLESAALTISVGVTGSPNTYQWTKGGVALDGTATNLDGTLRWPATVVQGVKKPTLFNPSVRVSDTGLYKLTINNPLSGTTSTADVNVTVLADTNKPTVVSVSGLPTPNASGPTPYLVKVLFNKRIDPTTGGDSTKYTITGPSAVTVIGVTLQTTALGASLGGDWREAILATGGLTPGATYTLNVNGVKDQTASGNTIAPVSVQFVAPTPVKGQLAWDYYYVGAGTLTALYSSPVYPSGPMTNSYVTLFDSTPITGGGDLNNVAGFGPLGDNYGASLSGWITPKVTTNYVFFLASDDSSDLYLSSDASPLNLGIIAQESTCCHGFQEPGVETVSTSQALVAGTSYFIRAVHAEGGGGDYVRVAWRMEGDTNAAASLQPISGEFLSAYAPPQFYAPVLSGGQVTLTWTGTGTLLESTDLVTWTPVAGNPASPYTFTPGPGPRKFYRVRFF